MNPVNQEGETHMVTVGMDYRVNPGREEEFEKVFQGVVRTLSAAPEHVATRLYRACGSASDYLILSEWTSRAAFEGFVASSAFRQVTAWGMDGILRDRPSHEVYEHGVASEARAPRAKATCPVSHAR